MIFNKLSVTTLASVSILSEPFSFCFNFILNFKTSAMTLFILSQFDIFSNLVQMFSLVSTKFTLHFTNYPLWIVYLNTRYNISYPFRQLLCFKMIVVWCIWRTLFLKEVYLSFCLKKVTFFEKKCFFLACNTHFTSIFTFIVHFFNPRLQKMC